MRRTGGNDATVLCAGARGVTRTRRPDCHAGPGRPRRMSRPRRGRWRRCRGRSAGHRGGRDAGPVPLERAEFSIGPSWTSRPAPSRPESSAILATALPDATSGGPVASGITAAWWRGPRRSRAAPPAPRTPRRTGAPPPRSSPCASPAVSRPRAAGRPGPPPLPSACRRPSFGRRCPWHPAIPIPRKAPTASPAKAPGGVSERPPPGRTPSRSERRGARWRIRGKRVVRQRRETREGRSARRPQRERHPRRLRRIAPRAAGRERSPEPGEMIQETRRAAHREELRGGRTSSSRIAGAAARSGRGCRPPCTRGSRGSSTAATRYQPSPGSRGSPRPQGQPRRSPPSRPPSTRAGAMAASGPMSPSGSSRAGRARAPRSPRGARRGAVRSAGAARPSRAPRPH